MLYVIATPIGNLEDITFRAVRILKEVDIILCEDTRVTKKLLQKYNIDTKTVSYHSHSKLSKVKKIIDWLKEGKKLALVSDAGTPSLSDPGALLVSKIRDVLPDVSIVPIPGPSALTSLLSVGGILSTEFIFLGFLPHKKGRETLFKEISNSKRTMVFYESPHRIIKTLESLTKYIDGNRQVIIGREMTKIYEEILSGSAKDLLTYFKDNKDKIRGEFVVIISP